MSQAAPRGENMVKNEVLHLAFELSQSKWKLGFSTGSTKVRVVTIDAGDEQALKDAIGKSKQRFGLRSDCEVHSCYEAGRDGFWLHRRLTESGIRNVVVDSSSIEVNRRARRAKTDRLDVKKLVTMLVRYVEGEASVWSVLRIPTVEEEDERRLHRELDRLKKERTSHRNRIRSLLVLHGLDIKVGRDFLRVLEGLTLRDGTPLPPQLRDELRREHARLVLAAEQLQEVMTEQKTRLKAANTPREQRVLLLTQLVGVGVQSAWPCTYELFGWRRFNNRRELAGAVGLVPVPYRSGNDGRDLGISKSGNQRIRRILIQVAWGWLRLQPQSALSRWFMERFGHGQGRMRRVGIVALARRLLIALWRFVEHGVVPDGAHLKPPSTLVRVQ